MTPDENDQIVLRRFRPAPVDRLMTEIPGKVARGLFIDSETTGLDPREDKLISLAAVPFRFTPEGEILEIGEPVLGLNDPGAPLSDEIIRLTGLTDDMLRGQKLDVGAFSALAAFSDIVIAFNSEFDRPFVERSVPEFMDSRWSCAMVDIPWWEKYRTKSLRYLMVEHCQMFYEGHRADMDALAATHLLSTKLDDRFALSYLIESLRKPWWRISATDSPYSQRHILKREGFRWNPDTRVWWKDVAGHDEAESLYQWIGRDLKARPKVTHFTSRERFSDRIGT